MVTDKMIEAFWSQVTVTRVGSIVGLEAGIECAIREMQSVAEPVKMRVNEEMVEAAHRYICGLYPYPQSKPETRQMLQEAFYFAPPAPSVAVKELPLAAAEKRDVDEVDVTGWGVLEGHAIPVAVAKKLAARINLCIRSAISAQVPSE